jgi:hypothetical protein
LIGNPTAVINAIVSHRLDRELVVAAVLAELGRATVEDLLPGVYPDVDKALEPVARATLWSHLQKLAIEGRARLADAEQSDPLSSSASSTWEAVGP